jgi:hypothetical protein
MNMANEKPAVNPERQAGDDDLSDSSSASTINPDVDEEIPFQRGW